MASSAVDQRTARLPAGSSAPEDDPFAGDDVLWANEDWTDHGATDEDDGLRLCFGLMVGLAVGHRLACARGILVSRLPADHVARDEGATRARSSVARCG